MSGIFGIVRRDGAPVATSVLDAVRRTMADWGPDGSSVWHDGPAALGQMRLFSTPEFRHERLPYADKIRGFAFTAAARVDNRSELGHLLGIPASERAQLGDSEFLARAYVRWGEDFPVRVFGDWAFAAWHPAEGKLFLARDHFGNTSLFYYSDPQVFAFASKRQALLEMNLAPLELDELFLAQVLVSWPAYHGERTVVKRIRRLPPAHALIATPERIEARQYWRLEDTPILWLPRREDYIAAFTEVFDESVRCRLRASDATPIGVTLSGGLDSSAVTATAAALLRESEHRLLAFTSVPVAGSESYTGARFGDEFSLAQATAQFAGNVELHSIEAAAINPIQGIRRMLEILDEPGHGAGNAYWILELERTARACRCRTLLTGQMGNGGVSWTGDVSSQPVAFQIGHLGPHAWLRAQARRVRQKAARKFPSAAATVLRRRFERRQWYRLSAIHPDFAARLHLLEQRLADPRELTPATPQGRRHQILMPGRSAGGSLHAQMGAVHGLEVRDPTADARVLAFTLSVPDDVFIDPQTGFDRWLIREAMKGRVPDEVRLNHRRGRQAADLVPRLRACAADVETALDELSRGPAAEYVDVAYMRSVWRVVKAEDTPEALRKSVTVLTRGIMAGLFVNQFEREGRNAPKAPQVPQGQLEAVS